MAQTIIAPEPLITGMRMEREEFIRRWDALPDLKNAELIEGTVFVSSPVGRTHSRFDGHFSAWLWTYANSTAHVSTGHNETCYMLESAPQPDCYLRIDQRGNAAPDDEGRFIEGAPELIVEICESSHAHDFGPKKALYQRAGVREYITVDTFAKRLAWRFLKEGSYIELDPDSGGILRSHVFPGLWLSPQHVWPLDGRAMLALLEQGLQSPEHAAFLHRETGDWKV